MKYSPLGSQKHPQDMSLEEVKLLLEIKKLELRMEGLQVIEKLSFARRMGIFIQKSGILDSLLKKRGLREEASGD